MPKTKITRETWKNHLHYSKVMYVIIAILAVFAVDLAYTTTEYRSPPERKVDIQLVSEYSDIEPLADIAAQALLDGQAADATLEAVSFVPLAYSGLEDDMYGAQKYMVMLAAQEGHIYFLNRPLMEQLVMQGGVMPLDSYIESGLLPLNEEDRLGVTYNAPDENSDEYVPLDETHVYAIPLSSLGKMLELDTSYDIRDKYAVIMSYCPNPDTTATVLRSVMDQLTGDLPDWLRSTAAPETVPAEGEASLIETGSVPTEAESPAPESAEGLQ